MDLIIEKNEKLPRSKQKEVQRQRKVDAQHKHRNEPKEEKG